MDEKKKEKRIKSIRESELVARPSFQCEHGIKINYCFIV